MPPFTKSSASQIANPPSCPDVWATAELCISIIIVALTALRPLLKRLTSLISSSLSHLQEKASHRIHKSPHPGEACVDPSPDMPWAQYGSSTCSSATACRRSDKSASLEAVFGKQGIVKVEEVTVSSEPACSYHEDSTSSGSSDCKSNRTSQV